MTPKLSLIIPVYKAENYISKTINLVKSQSFQDFECILIDDGSPDKSGEIIDMLTADDSRFIVVHKQNEGPSSARNEGLDVAHARIIVFMDADDIVSDVYLEDLYKEYINNGVDLVMQGMIKVQKGVDTAILLHNKIYNIRKGGIELLFQDLQMSALGGPCCKCFNAEILHEQNIRFSDKILYGEDFDFLLRYIPHCHKIFTSSSANYRYLLHEASASTSFHPFDLELSGLMQISSSFEHLQMISRCRDLSVQYQKCFNDYVWRILYSNYFNKYSFRESLQNLKKIPKSITEMCANILRNTSLFTAIVNNLLAYRLFFILNLLLSMRLKK